MSLMKWLIFVRYTVYINHIIYARLKCFQRYYFVTIVEEEDRNGKRKVEVKSKTNLVKESLE